MFDFETDIHGDWIINNGDLVLTDSVENLCQAIENRLSCLKLSLDIFYDDYGGFLIDYLGRKKTEETLNFMQIELDKILQQENRIIDYSTDLKYIDAGVLINLELYFGDDTTLDLNFLIGEDGTVENIE